MFHSPRMGVALLTLLLLLTPLLACGPGEPAEPAPTATDLSEHDRFPDWPEGPPDEPGIVLDGTEWVLTALAPNFPVSGTYVTLKFEDGVASGFAGCNHYGGPYWADDGELSIPEVAITAMACPEPEGVIAQERAYVAALTSAAAYHFDGGQLAIWDAQNRPVLHFAPSERDLLDPRELLGTAWELVSLDGQSPIESSTPSLVFHDEQRASGHAGCRDFVAGYRVTGSDLHFYTISMLGTDCPQGEALLAQEGEYTTLLEGARDYRLEEGRLELFTERGQVLDFRPLPGAADADLAGTSWDFRGFVEEERFAEEDLILYRVAEPLAGTEITLAFESGTASGSAGCNTYQAGYQRDGAALIFPSLAFTERGCAAPVMEQEARYLDWLREVTAYRVAGRQLWLDAGGGRWLVFGAGEW